MSTLELLTRLRNEGITLAAEGGQLRLKAPPGVLTTELRNELIANKAEILSLLNDAKAAGRSKPTGIPRIQKKGDLPPSFAQERLWFLDQLEPGTFAYNIPTSFRLQGMLDTAVLERSIGEIVRRHEPLRTVFVTVDGSARQHICPFEGFELSVLDLQGLPKDQQEEQVQRVGFDDARRPFDLRKSPLIRATLLKVAENANVLLINTHHIASDAWSFSIFARELGDIYDAFVHKRPSPLPELPVQYADFAVWQRQWLQGEILETQLAYWKRQLTGVLPVLELPTDRPRPIVRIPNGSTESIILTAPLGKAVKELSRHEGVTLFITLLAAFKILLCRYSGQEDVLVGMPIANRNRAEIEGLIGFFVNTLVARTDLSGNPGFRELLGRVREVALGAYAHQDLPFEKLVTELQPERSTSHAPIYQVAFNLWNTPAPLLKLPGLEPAQLQYHDGGAKEDLSLTFEDSVDGLTARCLYSTDLWDQPSIVRMLIHFQTLLEGIVSNPDQRISDLPLLTQQERHQMLVEWNRTEVAYPDDRCLHELLEEQVERTPEAVAVVFEDTQLTYRQLNERANRLAHYLRSLGVRPEQLVGVCMERSLEMVVALYGILKAGGAYVPIDPEYPSDRVAFMLDDAGVSVLLTQGHLVGRLPPHQAKVVCLDSAWEKIACETAAKPADTISATNLAYMIYTSGSSGRPKGVLVENGALLQHCLECRELYGLTSKDRVLQFASISFDAAIEQLLPPLLSGATVVLRDRTIWTPAEFQTNLKRLGLTVVEVSPAYWHQLAQAWVSSTEPISVHQLRLVIIGGDEMQVQTLQLWQQTPLNAVRLLNAYGPTEAVMTATSYEIPACRPGQGPLRRIPIGRPLCGREIYVLDRWGQPVPVGVAGELHIGGTVLARGYHNRKELTAEKFIPDPFNRREGARLYRTGDLARYLADGNIEFLGRLDQQVKIRGFRIELGEIESVLAGHPGVREAVALAREDVPGDKRLVAYVVTKTPAPTVIELRECLKKQVPDYMVPSALIILERFPVTPNGKVDRKALPVPEILAGQAAGGYVSPRTPVEVALARIWEEMLGLEQVGIHDNFFDLGGHSLLAAQLADRIQKSLRRPVALATIFRAPTIAALARHFESEQEQAFDLLEPIRSTGNGAVILCFGGRLMEHLSDLVPPHHPLYWCKLEHVDGKRMRYSTIEDLAAHYCRQISAKAPEGPYVLCGFSFGGLVAYETARQMYQRDRASTLLFLVEPSLGDPSKKDVPSRIAHHLRNFPSVPQGQRASYAYAKARASIQLVRRRIRQFYCAARLACGLRVPVNMRWSFVEDRYREATRRYVPQPFPGKLVLIHGEQYPADIAARWAALALGGITVYNNQSKSHVDLVDDQQWVKQWADLLKLHLQAPPEPIDVGGRFKVTVNESQSLQGVVG